MGSRSTPFDRGFVSTANAWKRKNTAGFHALMNYEEAVGNLKEEASFHHFNMQQSRFFTKGVALPASKQLLP